MKILNHQSTIQILKMLIAPRYSNINTTDIQGRYPRTCAFLSRHEVPIVGLWVFCNQNNRVSSGLSVKKNICKMLHEDFGRICFAFACVIDKNPKTPNFSLMEDKCYTRVYEVWHLPSISLINTENVNNV